MNQQPDSYFIDQVIQGDQSAYSVLVDRYKHMVYTLAVRLVKNEEDAEEIAQDAFIKAFKGLSNFKGTSQFSTWLYKIAYRTGLDHARKKQREPYRTSIENHEVQRFTAEGPSAIMEAEERTEQIKKAIAMLPGDMSIMLFLHYYDDRTLKEISQITGKSTNAIKVTLHRGRKRLAEILTDTMNVKAFTHEKK